MRRLQRLSGPRVAMLVALVAALAYLPASRTALVLGLEGQLLDLRFQLKPHQPTSDAVVLVLIDDASVAEIGRWPWPREVIADLVAAVDEAGAETIGIDLLFAEPEQETVPGPWLDALRAVLREVEGEEAAPAEDALADLVRRLLATAPGDRTLAATLRETGDAVIPFTFDFESGDGGEVPSFVAEAAYRIVRGLDAPADPPRAMHLVAPLAALGEAAAGLGHASILLDPSGAARFDYPVAAYGDDLYPSFAIEVARRHLGVPREQVIVELGQGIRLADRFVPTDEGMRLVVDYYRPGHFETVPAAAVLQGEVPAGAFSDRVVLIGGAAVGVGGGFVSPFGPRLLGLSRHAAVIENVLRADFLMRRDAYAAFGPGIVLLGGGLLGAAASRAGILGASALLAILAGAIVGGNLLAFLRYGLWLDLLLPLVALGLIYAAVVAYTYLVGQREQRILRNAFKHYLHPDLVDRVAGSPDLLTRGGEEKELTVLFADLRGSATLAALLPAPRFVELLNDFFEVTTRAIFAEGGMLNKFMGDGLLAVFGAPLPQDDHPQRACRAALAMRDALPALRRRWADAGVPALDFGVGINTGPMIIGNMGTAARFDYTVIGDDANLGARLEAANKDFGTRILVSEATFRRVEGELAGREIDVVGFRGIERPVRTFELLGPEPLPESERRRAASFAAGLAAYRAGDWSRALERFEEVLGVAGEDGPARLFAARCRERLDEAVPPPTD